MLDIGMIPDVRFNSVCAFVSCFFRARALSKVVGAPVSGTKKSTLKSTGDATLTMPPALESLTVPRGKGNGEELTPKSKAKRGCGGMARWILGIVCLSSCGLGSCASMKDRGL